MFTAMLNVEKKYSILLAIDPGLHNTGIAVYVLDLYNYKIISIDTRLISSKNTRDVSGLDDDLYEDEQKIRISQKAALKEYLEHFQPDTVVCESPFFDRFRPSSFMTLTRVCVSFMDAVIEYNPNCVFIPHAPQYVKKSIGVAGQKGKEPIERALSQMPLIADVLIPRLSEITEHERDAIAVGYSHLSRQYQQFARNTPCQDPKKGKKAS